MVAGGGGTAREPSGGLGAASPPKWAKRERTKQKMKENRGLGIGSIELKELVGRTVRYKTGK